MGIQKLIDRLLPFDELYATVRRFPLSVLCAVSLFIISLLIVHDVIDDDEEFILRVISVLGCCYFWFGISTRIGESCVWSRGKSFALSLCGAGAITALLCTSAIWGMHLVFLIPALLLFLMFAPYMTRGDDLSIWFFNRCLWFGVIVSYVALFLFAGGLSVALTAIHTLFDVKIEEEVYADIWLFACLVLGPLYALSWVPKRFEFTEEDCNDPPGLKFIVNWISAPMVFVYLLILYAYFIKIVVSGDVPNGHLAYMITGFAGAGIITYLAAWPLREEGSLQLRLFYKIFFPALLIPVGFHFYAIWERVSAYGITEQRYLILLSAVWFAIITISNLFQKIPIKAIPMTLGILMVFASFGPWGGVNVSGYSQFSRLETLMARNGLLVDGEIVKADDGKAIPFEDRQSISSILDYLCQSERDAMLAPWFDTKGEEKWSCYGGYKMTEQLGFEHVGKWARTPDDEYFYISSSTKEYMDVRDFDFIFRNFNAYFHGSNKDDVRDRTWDLEDGRVVRLEMRHNTRHILSVFLDDTNIATIDLNDFIVEKVNIGGNQTLEYDGENAQIFYRVSIHNFSGQMREGKPELNNINFDFLFRLKGQKGE